MKRIVALLSVMLIITSCSKDELEFIEASNQIVVEEEFSKDKTESTAFQTPVEVFESKALRTTLEALRENISTSKAQRTEEANNTALCFQFVYPITVAYNDGSTKQLMDYESLLQALLDETSALHLTGVGFPFDVRNAGTEERVTIYNEEEFKALISACGYDEISYTDVIQVTSSCFSVNYPLDLIVNDKVKTFMSEDEAVRYFNAYWTSTSTVTISYPFRVTLHTAEEDKRTSIENDFEMINLIKTTCGIE